MYFNCMPDEKIVPVFVLATTRSPDPQFRSLFARSTDLPISRSAVPFFVHPISRSPDHPIT